MQFGGNNKSCCKISTIAKFSGGNCFGGHLTTQRSTCGQTSFPRKGFQSTEQWLHKGI